MTTIYKVSKKLWIDSSKDIKCKELELETNHLATQLDNVIKECSTNPLNNPDIETIRKDERQNVLNELVGISDTKLEDFLDWIADRLVYVYHENPNTDFVLSLKHRATAARRIRQEVSMDEKTGN